MINELFFCAGFQLFWLLLSNPYYNFRSLAYFFQFLFDPYSEHVGITGKLYHRNVLHIALAFVGRYLRISSTFVAFEAPVQGCGMNGKTRPGT